MNYLNKACHWVFPHLDPYHVVGSVVSGGISMVIEAGIRDKTIGKIVSGIGFIGGGCCVTATSYLTKNIKNKAVKNILMGTGVVSVAYGIHLLSQGIKELIYPLDLMVGSPCSLDYKWKTRNFTSSECFSEDPNSLAISKIKISTSQIGNSYGICDYKKTWDIVKQLKNCKIPAIKFETEWFEKHQSGEYQSGAGACSAMSLDLAARVNNECNLENANSTAIINCFERLAPDYNTSNQAFRNRQAAFNTITVNPRATDPARLKIEALASFHSFSVDLAIPKEPILSKVDNICDEPLEKFIKEINQAPTGTYFVRALVLEQNKKLEYHGHSTVLFKLEKGSVYYNPNWGFKGLLNCDLGEKIYNFLFQDTEMWSVSYPRLYRLSCKPKCENLSSEQ